MTGTSNGAGFYGMMKLKQTLKIGLVNTGIKSTPCEQWNILLYFLCCGPIFLLEILDILLRYMASCIISNTNKEKINKWLTLRNLIMGHVWIFQPYNYPNTNLKNNTKMGYWAQNQASATAIPVLWPEPYYKWVGWTEEKKHHHGSGNLKGLKWFWMKEWSLISCQVFSNIIRHYRRNFRAVKLTNGGFKNYWIKGFR